MHREGRKGLRIPWTWEVLTAAVYHDHHLFPTGGKGHHSPTATCSIVPTSSWLPYWFLLSPGKPVGWSGSTSKPISSSSQDPPLDWIAGWSLSNWVPRYWCCCLLHWSGLSGQCPQQPPGGFSKARQHSGVFVLVSVHCNYRPLSVYFIPFVLFPLFFCFYLLICVLVRTSGHMIVM